MTKNDLASLHKFSSPLDYPTQTPLVSFISFYALDEAGLIISLGTLTLTYIDQVSSMKSSVLTISKTGGIIGQGETKTCKRI